MAKKAVLSKLHKPVTPVLALVIIGLVVIAGILTLVMRENQNPTSQQYQSQTYPTFAPPPTTNIPTPTINTVDWKTYTDWKYGYSIKLPPEFASYIPTKGYTGNTIDPQGNGFAQFEDTTLSGDYPNRIAKYGFYVRIEPDNNPASSNCTTDQECLKLAKKIVGRATAYPLQARFLNRDIKGIATVNSSPNSSSLTGHDLSVNYDYPFVVNGLVFHAEIGFYYPKSFQETQTKTPYINAILATISFNK